MTSADACSFRSSDQGRGTMPERGWFRRLYDWVIGWADSPYGSTALFVLAFAESSFFPIPPDVLLIALALGAPSRAFRLAAICTAGSVLGGMLGYYIGYSFFEVVGFRILEFYHAMDKFETVRDMYRLYDVWFVGIAGFTPIPYKVFTIAAGTFAMDFPRFVIVSLVSRGARFFIVSALIWKFGAVIKSFIDRYFNYITILFCIILVAGFILVKFILG